MRARAVLLVLVGLCSIWCSVEASKQRLMVVLLDGMRYDYVHLDPSLEALPRIAKEGVTVQYVTPIYPSISYPNWYTIVTGLYTESHGMIGNNMYDSVRKEYFDMNPNATAEHWWNKTEPLWVTAEKNGRRTAMHYWDGCQVSIRGSKPTLCDKYKAFKGWTTIHNDTEEKLEADLKWFEESEDNRLSLIYYEGTDAIGHEYGPESKEMRKEVQDVDKFLGKFLEELDKSTLKSDVNLMIVSDHGMTDIRDNKVIPIDDFDIGSMTEKFIAGGAYAAILPVKGKEDEVYSRLKTKNVTGLKVYSRDEIPESYHYKNGELTFPILLVADMGYYIAEPNSTTKKYNGTHGYDPYLDNSPMRTILYAKGPAFKRGVVGSPIDQTDHYNIFCHILEMKALPNNGSFNRISNLLVSSGKSIYSYWWMLLITLIILLCTQRNRDCM